MSAGPFTTAEALAAGVSKKILRGPSVRRVARGVYLSAEHQQSLAHTVEAMLRLLPAGTLATGVTALQLLGIDLGPARPLHFCTTSSFQSARDDLRVQRVRQLPPRRGSSVAPAYALLVAATELNIVDLVAAGDRVLRLRSGTKDELVRVLSTSTGRGCRAARRAATLIRERVDSVQESRLRLLVTFCGLPEPECNPSIGTEFRLVGHVDLALERWMVMIEYEGDQHRSDRKQWDYDVGRYEELTAAGWIVIRVTAAAMRKPRGVAQRVYDALSQHGYAGPPPCFDEEWITLFEHRE